MTQVEISLGQITDLAVDAIVCADNSGLAVGRGCLEARSSFSKTHSALFKDGVVTNPYP